MILRSLHRLPRLISLSCLAGISSALADTFTWQGDNNNNWQNDGNWSQTPGSGDVPDGTTDFVVFDSTADRFDVDLNSNDRNVGHITFDVASGGIYHIESSNSDGILRNNGNLTSSAARQVFFDNTITYYQQGNGTWATHADPQYMIFNAALEGSGNIALDGGVTLNASGDYSGKITVGDTGVLKLGHNLALKSATVQLDRATGGLVIATSGKDAVLGALSGSGNIGISGQSELFVGRNNASTSYSGRLTDNTIGGVSPLILTKSGTGTWTLTGANVHTGSTVIGNGVLSLGNDNALSNSAVTINVNNGLVINSRDVTLGSLAGTGNLNLGAGTLTVGGTNASSTYSGVLSGGGGIPLSTGSLTKIGTGTLTLAGANTYTKSTYVEGGTLSLQHSQAAGVANGNLNAIYLFNGTTLDYGSGINVGNVVALRSDAILNVSTGVATHSGNITDITDGNGFTKTGAGSLTLASGGSYSGATQIDAGSLILANAGTLGSSTVHLNVDDGLDITTHSTNANLGGLTGSGDLDLGAQTLTVGGNGSSTTYSGLLSGTGGSLVKTGNGTLTLAEANTFTGPTLISNGSIILANSLALQNSTVSLNVDDGLDLTTHALDATLAGLAGSGTLGLGTQTLTVGANGGNTVFAGLFSGSGNLIKTGTNTLTLTGGTGAAPSQIQSLQPQAGELILSGGGHLFLNGGGYGQSSTLRVSGTGTSLEGSGYNIGNFNNNVGSMIVENNASVDLGNLRVGNVGSGSLAARSGAELTFGTLRLAYQSGQQSTADFTGLGTEVLADSLDFGFNNAAGSGVMTIEDDADLLVSGRTAFRTTASALTVNGGSISTGTLVNLSGGSPVISLSDPAGGTALTIGTNDGSSTWDGVIQDAAGGSGSILKSGTGTLTLTVASSYSGGSVVSLGTLLANNTSGSATGSGAVAVLTGATLGGGGSIAGPVTVNAGGGIAPGNSTGTLTLENALTLGGTYLCQIDGPSADLLVVSGNINLSGSMLSLDGLAGGLTEESYIIANAGSISGTFATITGLPTGYKIVTTGTTISIIIQTPFEKWAEEKGLTPGVNDAPGDDPENDGRTNLEEFALDGDPLSGATEGKQRAAILDDGGTDYFSLTVPVRSGAVFTGSPSPSANIDGITYTIEGSAELTTFTESVVEASITDSAGLPALTPGWEYHTFYLDSPQANTPKGFLRVVMEEQ